jgi:hypothetical protein
VSSPNGDTSGTPKRFRHALHITLSELLFVVVRFAKRDLDIITRGPLRLGAKSNSGKITLSRNPDEQLNRDRSVREGEG